MNAPDAAVGKKVKCPKCAAAVPVPAAESDNGFEVVDEAPAPVNKPPVAKALPLPKPAVVEAEVVDPPKPKYKPRVVEDDSEDEDDDRPRKKAAKKGRKKGPPVVLLAAVGGGVLLFGILAVGGYFLFGGKSGAGLPGVGSLADSPPAGFSALRDDKAGYRVYVPGQAQILDSEVVLRQSNQPNAAQLREQMRTAPFTYNMIMTAGFGGGLGSLKVGGRATIYKDFKPGNSRQMLMDELKKVAITMDAEWNFPPEVTEIQLDGRPALIVRVKANELWMQTGPNGGHAAVMKDAPKDFQDRAKKADEDWNAQQAQQAAGRRPGTADRAPCVHRDRDG